MGRSKFPGKPSKSINRKRISVLQLDPNTSSSGGGGSAAVNEASGPGTVATVGGGGGAAANSSGTHHNSRSSSAAGESASGSQTNATATASSSSNSEDEENLRQTKTPQAKEKQHQGNGDPAEEEKEDDEDDDDDEEQEDNHLNNCDKHKNGKREDHDDDDDEEEEGGHFSARGNGSSSSSSGSSRTTTNGYGEASNSSSSSMGGGQRHNGGGSSTHKTSQNSLASIKIPKPSLSAKVEANCNSNKPKTSQAKAKEEQQQQQQQEKKEDRSSISDECRKSLKSPPPPAPPSSSSTSSATSQQKSLRNCKKFKNLNIHKPEVMLPSSSKLKLQQQQQQNSHPEKSHAKTIPASPGQQSSLATSRQETTTEPVIGKQQQQHQHTPPQICEMSSSSGSTKTTTSSVSASQPPSPSSSTDKSPTSLSSSASPRQTNNDAQDDGVLRSDTLGKDNNKKAEDANNVAVTAASTVSLEERKNSCIGVDQNDDDHHDGDDDDAVGDRHHGGDDDGNSSSPHSHDSKPALKSSNQEQPVLPTNNQGGGDTSESAENAHPSEENSLKSKTNSTTVAESTTVAQDMATSSAATNGSSSASSSSTPNSSTDKKQKKTVTFKNVLETSDDKSAVKKFYNPDNRKPLISIIKKECLNRPLMYTRNSECIVKPSRLTEILKNNSNIDKLNSLKFRSNSVSSTTSSSSSVLSGPLSRVFGAPLPPDDEEEQQNQNVINFRLSKPARNNRDEDEEEEDDDDGEDDDDDEEEEEQGEGDEEMDEDEPAKGEEKGGDKNHHQAVTEATDVGQRLQLPKEKEEAKLGDNSNVIKGNDEEHQIVLDKHFVLPKRSCRSSRLIKPNKRLVEDSILGKKPTLKSNLNSSLASSSATAAAVAQVKEEKSPGITLQTNYFGLGGDYKSKECNGLMGSKSSKDGDTLKPSAFAAATSNVFSNFGNVNSLLSSSTSTSLSSSSSSTSTKPSSFILRQPRLQFESLSATAASTPASSTTPSAAAASAISTSDRSNVNVSAAAALALSASLPKSLLQAISSSSSSPNSSGTANSGSTASSPASALSLLSPTFSLNHSSNNNNGGSSLKNNTSTASLSSLSAGTSTSATSILCVVCSSPIHTKNLPQASKYGQLSCEYCRKFISKIAKKSLAIKNSAINKPIIPQCKVDGNCPITPLNKGIHIKNFKKLYKERCGLCWLKKCLHTLQLPKVRLNALLPVLNAVIGGNNSATSGSISNNNNSKNNNLIEMKIRKDMELLETAKLSINWKATPIPKEVNTSPSISTSTPPALNGGKSSIKSNSIGADVGGVTFGSLPLLRPAILEKPSLIKPSSLMETKLELSEKLDKKPLEILKDVKLEIPPASSSSLETTTPSTNKLKPKEKKDRKDVKIKEMPSPKMEEKLKDSKEIIEKSEVMEGITTTTTAGATASMALENSSLTVNGCPALLATPPPSGTSSSGGPNAPGGVSSDKRQRIDLKGPRVKHVCRSASIVLGQPLAMFGEDEEQQEHQEGVMTAEDNIPSLPTENVVEKSPLTDENDNCASCKTQQLDSSKPEDIRTEQPPPLKVAKMEVSTAGGQTSTISNTTTTTSVTTTTTTSTAVATTRSSVLTTSKLSQRPHHYNTHLTTGYKNKFSSQMVATNSSSLATAGALASANGQRQRKDPLAASKCKLLISIDFWENYDPAEVCQTGFGLIITETVAQRALCFLCGSAGQDPLIFCACCCEPYHQYCVQDEFNLKHGSLDETLLLNESCLSITASGAGAGGTSTNTAIAKLNWLCPRCTVCYTCNMSSGAKVKCQKCQKNYHSTCLGTSKRLLGADRPLICVNCLKCRSCSTTKVTKFVGNLPMCTSCFRLRKRGNFCPVCQKCYDDQDFDLKMMECGDCHQWVHAKCETLTDEQYNLLSTLPESIEFICKRCSRKSPEAKQRANEWREAVREEFQSNLMSVLKLLSKSRQACSLLRLSPRKQMKCSCGGGAANNNNNGSNSKYQPKSLQFNQDSQNPPSSTNLNIDVYEFDDQERDTEAMAPPLPLALEKKCVCNSNSSSHANGGSTSSSSSSSTSAANQNLSLVEIKQKITSDKYQSLAEFHYDMSMVIHQANCDELEIVYKELLSEQFPWFQNETQACTDALEEDMYETSGGAYGINTSLDTENDYQMDCLPTAEEQHEEAQRSALLAELPQDLEDQMYGIKSRTDSRICLFCRRSGEGLPQEESRLLYCGHDCWVHTNCALWSAEVFEEIDGSLQNVHSAVARGRMIKCSVCGNRGATVGCNIKSCGEHYHYPCARSKNCAFLADKSMYCPAHAPNSSQSAEFETQFEVLRPVYVELERKRKKLVEPSKVQFHIGSLEVKQLGHILPRFSDTYEALVPVNFLCSRLYWSSKEPWKIVEYTVRTYIHNSSSSSLSSSCLDMGKNFTVDHSQTNTALIHLGLTQIQQWHSSLNKATDYDNALEDYEYLQGFSNTSHHSNHPEQTNTAADEEPQNNADLLPPEIKEAIFEDLPGDLLEGISMLDIFTKCMNYEDMVQGEQTPLTDEDTMTSIGAFTKQLTAELNNGWPVAAAAAGGANSATSDDALFSSSQAAAAVKLQKLKKSSSPIINCGDVNAKHAIKRRKISENMLITFNQQHQQRSHKSKETNVRLESSNKRSFTWSAEKRYNLETSTASGDSKLKIMQVDGVDDSVTEFRFIPQDNTAIKCERCQCTYRNLEGFQRHLATCSTGGGESETPEGQNTTTTGITLEQLQELNNKLQQQQRAASQLPFLQAIPTTNQTLQQQLQGLQAAAAIPQLQLQNVQQLQNLQQLQQLQQLTQAAATAQPQSLGGNFFISTTANNQPEVVNNPTTADLQLYANALQGLTANLNGTTFTLQPTAGTANHTFAQAPAAAPQPTGQLLALSTNADGSQQIIQLPAHNTSTPATYQTLQATNTDKKIILPVGGGKPMKTMATKAAQQAAAKNKLKATTAVKPLQSKVQLGQQTTTTSTNNNPNTLNNNTNNAATAAAAAQLLNQQILQQLQQQAQVQAQQNANNNATTPQIVFQTTSANPGQPQIIMQQPQQNIISFVTTSTDGGQQQPQFQYVTLPTTNNQQIFATTNGHHHHGHTHAQPLMQSAYLQTDASGNLVLTSGPPTAAPQAPTPLQLLTGPGSQVIGTLIQPQTLQLQGGNVLTAEGLTQNGGGATTQTQQQVIISNGTTAGGPGGGGTATGLEMLAQPTATPQLVLAAATTNNPPMYYGLETIVQNTVMSSQQFVSTAMPGVLSQNASFSATTTQVFQASKIEPLVDIPAGYVLLNNVDPNQAAAAILQSQQPQAATNQGVNQQAAANQASFIQAALQQQAAAAAAANLVEQQQQQQQQQHQQNLYRQAAAAAAYPQIVVTPNLTQQQQQQSQQPQQVTLNASTLQNPAQATTTTYVDPNTGTVYSAKVTPMAAQVKRGKASAAATPMAAANITKVQPQQVVVNKVMPNVAQLSNIQTSQQLQQQQQVSVATPQQQPALILNGNQKPKQAPANKINPVVQQQHQGNVNSLKSQQNQEIAVGSNNNNANKKTNMIRPLNKAEVKPKVMKTATATMVTKANNNTNSHNNTNAILNPNNKMIILKPQQQQQQQQHQQQSQIQIESNLSQLEVRTNITLEPATMTLVDNNNLGNNPAILGHHNNAEHVLNSEIQGLQQTTQQLVPQQHQQQHYNVADNLLMEENPGQTTLTHCSFSNNLANFETHNSQQQQQQQQSIPTNNETSNTTHQILPTIQRMPQYTNINIVNPLQQYSAATTTTASSLSTLSNSSTTTTTVTRPTNRVLPMQQKISNNSTTTTTTNTLNSNTSSAINNNNFEQHNPVLGNSVAGGFCTTSTITTTSSTTTSSLNSSTQDLNSHSNLSMVEESMKNHGLNKIAYEAEVKQMLLHSPNPQQDSAIQQQQQMQQQHVMYLQQEAAATPITLMSAKVSPPTPNSLASYEELNNKAEDNSKLCYVPQVPCNNYMEEQPANNISTAAEECLGVEPKFPAEGEIILSSQKENGPEALGIAAQNLMDMPGQQQAENPLAENNDNHDAVNAGEEEEDDDEEDDDGFSLKMPSTNCSDNLSMDSDEPAVKEKISKILDNLTNEECAESLNTPNTTTLEASTAGDLHSQNNEEQTYLTNSQQQLHTSPEQQLATATDFYNSRTPEETSALLADVELAVENIKEKLQEPSNQYHQLSNNHATAAAVVEELIENHVAAGQQGPMTSSSIIPPPSQPPPTRQPKRVSGPHLLYEIQSEDGFTYKSTSIAEVWEKVFEAVQVARRANGLAPLPEGPLADMSGVQMIGLKTNALKYLIEQLPGVEKCNKYTPKYHKRNHSGSSSSSVSNYSTQSHLSGSLSALCSTSSLSNSSMGVGGPSCLDVDGNSLDYNSEQEELNENPYDCARCEPYSKRSEYDMFSWLASRHRKQPVQVFVQPSDNELVPRRGTGSNLPMAMKYRTLKETYKDYVGVFRSHIHGRGLYCTKDIEAGEMVIEYAGELIRSTLTDQRERYYNSRGIGCYMFKIDDNLVVDATMRGNAARFINHSCEPNCYSKVVDILGHKHIIIFALRRIVQGEELTYDYKFPFEDEKIPCSCGSKKCRKYLN